MTQYLKGQFSVLPPTSQEFRDNFDRTFGKGSSVAPERLQELDSDQAPCANCATGGHEHCLTPGTCKCYFCLADSYRKLRDDARHFLIHRATDYCDRCQKFQKDIYE